MEVGVVFPLAVYLLAAVASTAPGAKVRGRRLYGGPRAAEKHRDSLRQTGRITQSRVHYHVIKRNYHVTT